MSEERQAIQIENAPSLDAPIKITILTGDEVEAAIQAAMEWAIAHRAQFAFAPDRLNAENDFFLSPREPGENLQFLMKVPIPNRPMSYIARIPFSHSDMLGSALLHAVEMARREGHFDEPEQA